MASVSIQGRMDGEVLESIRHDGETITQTLRRVTDHYQATSPEQLTDIAPTPAAAIAVLLHSHQLLNQFAASGQLQQPSEPVPTETETDETTEVSAANFADDF